ncbi:uncharacterized protein LOC119598573 [Penaeus monodon]|uniref:uncharacterized protein LOC119598573 n=1 Tax=Penaeus monodon TaxID=6687 RepID=UPI0018A7143D|nr:uncharacterized protein LOC119598573 [Penaeus monodon]
MASKKAAAHEKRQFYKNSVLEYLKEKGEEDAHARDEVLTNLTSDLGLNKDEKNALNQAITTMVAQGLLTLEMDNGRENLRLYDADKSISKPKKKKKKARKGKSKRFKPEPIRYPDSIATTSVATTSVATSDSDVESD